MGKCAILGGKKPIGICTNPYEIMAKETDENECPSQLNNFLFVQSAMNWMIPPPPRTQCWYFNTENLKQNLMQFLPRKKFILTEPESCRLSLLLS